ncbi:hypothetical protein VOLCADRAFT_95499 [Volvox carteri f. nagariensis]|uniref:Uncharacterized protein n=1 Tax=Volvox carteri f. nagariensis TaxID=3068 RepID=D8U7M4_VOLCA|nr:uncharacterized protein VOLCADRAFT_95499 [Volvox carteri f. nagariensis]EFJ44260.1 hypothetical protein VOLCADRAFT_95499 [Volvox carteri f. nagariensis]|eukprot:XP_002954619.1 hypothetical protein VOLCADRAFT_95499 [Volvox carteri f. nagariensis]
MQETGQEQLQRGTVCKPIRTISEAASGRRRLMFGKNVQPVLDEMPPESIPPFYGPYKYRCAIFVLMLQDHATATIIRSGLAMPPSRTSVARLGQNQASFRGGTQDVGGMLMGDDNRLYGAAFPGSPLVAARSSLLDRSLPAVRAAAALEEELAAVKVKLTAAREEQKKAVAAVRKLEGEVQEERAARLDPTLWMSGAEPASSSSPKSGGERRTYTGRTGSVAAVAAAIAGDGGWDGDTDAAAAAAAGGGGVSPRRPRPASASAATSPLVTSLRWEVRQLTATRDALASQLAELKASSRVQRLQELQAEVERYRGEVSRQMGLMQLISSRLDAAEGEAAEARAALQSRQHDTAAAAEGGDGGAVPLALPPGNNLSKNTVRLALVVLQRAHKLIMAEARLVKSSFPPQLSLPELRELSIQRPNTAGAVEALVFLNSHIARSQLFQRWGFLTAAAPALGAFRVSRLRGRRRRLSPGRTSRPTSATSRATAAPTRGSATTAAAAGGDATRLGRGVLLTPEAGDPAAADQLKERLSESVAALAAEARERGLTEAERESPRGSVNAAAAAVAETGSAAALSRQDSTRSSHKGTTGYGSRTSGSAAGDQQHPRLTPSTAEVEAEDTAAVESERGEPSSHRHHHDHHDHHHHHDRHEGPCEPEEAQQQYIEVADEAAGESEADGYSGGYGDGGGGEAEVAEATEDRDVNVAAEEAAAAAEAAAEGEGRETYEDYDGVGGQGGEGDGGYAAGADGGGQEYGSAGGGGEQEAGGNGDGDDDGGNQYGDGHGGEDGSGAYPSGDAMSGAPWSGGEGVGEGAGGGGGGGTLALEQEVEGEGEAAEEVGVGGDGGQEEGVVQLGDEEEDAAAEEPLANDGGYEEEEEEGSGDTRLHHRREGARGAGVSVPNLAILLKPLTALEFSVPALEFSVPAPNACVPS